MPKNFYTTIENQVRENNGKGLLYDHFDDYNEAIAKYFTICAAAAISEIPYHSAHIIRDDGVMIEGRVFDRRDNGWYYDEDEAIWKKGVKPEPEVTYEPEVE